MKRELRNNLQPKHQKPIRWAKLRWIVPFALICAIALGAGLVIAGLTIHRTINVNVSGQSMSVNREIPESMTLTRGETKSLVYTVTNTSGSSYSVTVTPTIPEGFLVQATPSTFTLIPSASQDVTVAVTAPLQDTTGTIDLAFTTSP